MDFYQLVGEVGGNFSENKKIGFDVLIILKYEFLVHNFKLFLTIKENKMLVEFRVKNFRSLRDEQVLSFVASKDKTLQDSHTQVTGLKAAPRLLRSAVVYGANASGKSNLIKALQFMRMVVINSARSAPGQTFDALQPFRLNAESAKEPTEFEVTFILTNEVGEKIRYQYGFAMTSQRVIREHLLVYKAFKPQRWFERHFDDETGKDVYAFGSALKGAKNLWEGATRENSLFLSMAVQLNSLDLRPVFDWFAHRLVILNEHSQFTSDFSMQMLKQNEQRKRICDFLVAADISIADIDVVPRKVMQKNLHFDMTTGKGGENLIEREVDEFKFRHITEQGEALFDLADESSGTRSLLLLAGPVLDILSKGLVLVVDELDTSLHTLLVRELVRLFHQPESNTGDAQLLFSTHDSALLDAPNLFRRDQVWFAEKDRDQASSLVSLAEFSPRKNEALERGYLIGRYGGIPFLSNEFGLKY